MGQVVQEEIDDVSLCVSQSDDLIESEGSLQQDKEVEVTYELSSIVEHSGSLDFGHYTAVANKNGKWVYFSDSYVKEISEKEALRKQAYILFYKRV